MPRRSKARASMSEGLFGAVLAMTRKDPEAPSVKGARLVLVEGRPITYAAEVMGVSRQAIQQTASRITWRARNSTVVCPCCGRMLSAVVEANKRNNSRKGMTNEK